MDEARIVFSLVDDSGNSAGTASAPSPQGGSIPPGSQVAQDFHDRISDKGADSGLGRGAYTPTPVPSYATAQTPSASVSASGDPLLTAARQILAADPKTTNDELQAALGIQSNRAQSLIDSIYTTSQTPSPAAQPSQGGAQSGGYGLSSPTARAQPDLDSRYTPTSPYSVDSLTRGAGPTSSAAGTDDLIRGVREQQASESANKAASAQRVDAEAKRRIDELGSIEDYSPFGSSYDPFHVENQPVGAGDLDAAARMAQSARVIPTGTLPQEDEGGGPIDMRGLNMGLHMASGIANQFGGLGRVAATAISSAGAIANIPAISAAIAPVAAALAPIAAPLAVIGAGMAVGAAAGYAIANETTRAISLAREFSPEAAQASAQAEVSQLVANMRSADRLGDEAAGAIKAGSRLNASAQGLRDLAAEPILQETNRLLQGMAAFTDGLNSFFQNNPTVAKGAQGVIAGGARYAAESIPYGIGDLIKVLNKMNTKLEKEEGLDTPFSWFESQPFLTPPAPFTLSTDTPGGVSLVPIAGLTL